VKQNFNILITGVGGQGLVTLVDVLAKAILADGKDVKSSELHGLSQRGGAVAIYVSMGERVFSPLFKKGDADLVLGLDLLEGLRACDFANNDTKLLINDYLLPFVGIMPKEEILINLQKVGGQNLHLVEASKICKEKMQKEILATMYLLGYAVYKKYLDIKPESVIIGMKKVIPEKYLQMNMDAFNLAKN
jgi:indolepyruvate ferredoxin oxidoreductase beta subunit